MWLADSSIDDDVEGIGCAGFEEVGDVVFEAEVAALVYGADGFAVDEGLGVRHDAFKDEEVAAIGKVGWEGEGGGVMAMDGNDGDAGFRFGAAVFDAVGEDSEALEFPVGGYGDGGGGIGVLAGGAGEFPGDGIVFIMAGEVEGGGLGGGLCGKGGGGGEE